MKLYDRVCPAVFLMRPNRFIARCRLVDGREVVCHVKNTGRCRELLLPGTEVYLAESDNPARKTRFDLVTVRKGSMLVNLDSQAPNRVFQAWAEAGGFLPDLTALRPEIRYGDSRFDFAFTAAGRQGFAEIKGVTLEENGVAYFPDAPTERGVKHVEELCKAAAAGYGAYLCFVVAMPGMTCLRMNDRTHPAFGDAVRHAAVHGVKVLALGCTVAPDGFAITERLPVVLDRQMQEGA